MRASPSFLPLALLLALIHSPLPTSALTKNCRKCQCTVTLWDYYLDYQKDDFFVGLTNVITGGDGLSWETPLTKVPGSGEGEGKGTWKGVANFPRLCGKAPKVNNVRKFHYWNQGDTMVSLVCDGCGKNVKCNGGSVCENSGLE